jgi:hypothetical protein
MRRAHRTAHRIIWPVLVVVTTISFLLGFALRPPPEEPPPQVQGERR